MYGDLNSCYYEEGTNVVSITTEFGTLEYKLQYSGTGRDLELVLTEKFYELFDTHKDKNLMHRYKNDRAQIISVKPSEDDTYVRAYSRQLPWN